MLQISSNPFFRNNDLTGRVGGDEFLVLMKNTTLEKAKERAGNLGEALCKVYTGGLHSLQDLGKYWSGRL